MKKITLFVLSFLTLSIINAQNININPDKTAEPWIVGGLRVPSEAEINKIPTVKNVDYFGKSTLPASLDNSQRQFFRPIFNQTDGCCAQASGVAYNFTYEMNYLKNTSANITANQFPTHFTYNFLNTGDGNVGSVYTDGWDIIKSAGCPTIQSFGGIAGPNETPYFWISSYPKYESAMSNKTLEYFAFELNTPAGLETLKQWMYDHLDNSQYGGIANFSAGVSDVFNMTSDNKIIEWGHSVNHAMTFVGYDDNVEYDFNNDGQITNNIDINNDQIIDMRDWEKGALIMANSWGTFWGNQGKAYVMYKLLAEPVENGGILADKAFSIKVRETYTPKITMRVKLSHNSRKLIKIYAGISTDLTSTTPEQTIEFPIFNFQGGDFPMQGEYSDPIEISLDVTKLLSYIEPNQEAKYFLLIDENDENSIGSGQIYDFSIYNVNTGTSAICTTHNTQILNNQTTKLSVNSTVNFDAPQIITSELPQFSTGNNYEKQMEANGGTPSYAWNFSLKYNEETVTGNFPNITSTQLSPSSDDDGVVSQSLDFSFPFYGKTYNQLIVSTDGSIIFSNDFSYLRNESAIINNKMIAVFAADLMYFPSDGIYYQGDANSATFRWKASLFENEDANIDVAVKIFPSGEIQYYYGSNITTGLVWASGISAGDGLNYSISSNSGIQNPSDNKYKFIAPAFPLGMNISKTGLFSGIPQTEGSWDINFLVTDFDNISKSKTLNFSGTTSGINCNEISKENISIYPNPVFNETCINFEITEQSMVEIEIFNTTGQSVKKLICNKLAKGNYNQKWDKTNYSGKIVESGTYFVRIKIDNKEYKKTLVCLKK